MDVENKAMDFFEGLPMMDLGTGSSLDFSPGEGVTEKVEPEEQEAPEVVEPEFSFEASEEDFETGDIVDESEEDIHEPQIVEDEVSGEDNLAYVLAKSYKEEGILPKEWDIPKDLDGKGLQQKIYETVKESFSPDEFLESQGYDKKTIEIAKYMANGIDPRLVDEGYRLKKLASASITTEEGAEQLLRYYYSQTLDPKSVERQIRGAFEDGEEMEEVARIQKELGEKSEQIFAKEKQRIADQVKSRKEAKERVIKAIQTQKFGSRTLEKHEQEDLIKYTYSPAGTVKIGEVNKEVTGIEKDLHDIYSDPVKFVKFAKMVKEFKGDFKKLKDRAVVEAAENTLDVFNRRRGSTTVSNSKGRKDNLFSQENLIGELLL